LLQHPIGVAAHRKHLAGFDAVGLMGRQV
jgi:hypothetical protein